MTSLNGRTGLITGAARGIGAACARRLAGDGARLVLVDVDGPGVEKLAAELGQVAVRADVTKPDDIARMVDEPYRRWGRLDVLFNNAGVIRVQPMLEVTEVEWDRVMDVNLRAVFFVLQAVVRRMLKQDLIAGVGAARQADPDRVHRGLPRRQPPDDALLGLQGRGGEHHPLGRAGAGR